jgi:Flp pilus assembly protein TadD
MKSCRLLSAAAGGFLAMIAVSASAAGDERFGPESWRAAVIEAGLDPEVVVFPFSVSSGMAEWAEQAIGGRTSLSATQKLVRIQEAMFEEGGFDFAYEGTSTLTAEEAFESRNGNCISFTALFIALTRSLGVPTRLMSVTQKPRVERDDGLVVINRHVVAAYQSSRGIATFDFNMSSETELVGLTIIDDVEASAMFHNNLGATALREGNPSGGLKHFGLTTRLWPEWGVGWVNLGVTLAHLGNAHGALGAYNRALEMDPGNSSALNNMAHVYQMLGREAEARTARRAAARTTENPFTLVSMADSEMIRGNLDEAAAFLKRAKRWYSSEPEVFDGLARLARRRGEAGRESKFRRKAERLRVRRESQR